MSRKIYVIGPNNYANWMEGEIVDSIEKADLVVFTGGEDVHPSVYGEPMGNHTYSCLPRDKHEQELFKYCLDNKIPMIGICRGCQFLSVMSGSRLVQHQDNPSYIHPITTYDGKELLISSTHHQAAYPYDMNPEDYKLLGWTEGISKFHLNGENVEISTKPFKEAEIVYYPKTNCLGIQGHPEGLYNQEQYKETIEYLRELLNKFLKKEL